VTVEQPTARPQDVVGAARFDLEAVYGADGLAEWVSSIRTMNSVLVVTMTKTPTTLSIIDEYWRVCRTLASTVTVPDIEAGKTALAVIRPNGDTVVYAVAGETSCKVV
jgi:hypothetical protein